MSNPSHLIHAVFNAANLPRKSIGRGAYVGLVIATTGASVLCGGSAAHSGPCTLHIAQLELGQIIRTPGARQITTVIGDILTGDTHRAWSSVSKIPKVSADCVPVPGRNCELLVGPRS